MLRITAITVLAGGSLIGSWIGLALGVTRAQELPRPKAIMGTDDRQAIAQNLVYPWSAIGQIWPGPCTATLVGESWLLTNAHCVVDYERGTSTLPKITFQPAVQASPLLAVGQVVEAQVTEAILGTDFADTATRRAHHPRWVGISARDSGQDWALLKLDRPLGQHYGYWQLRGTPAPKLIQDYPQRLSIVGYPQDFTAGDAAQTKGKTLAFQESCSILSTLHTHIFVHDCDTAKGSSGAPIFYQEQGQYYIVALNNASTGIQNYAVDLQALPMVPPQGDPTADPSRGQLHRTIGSGEVNLPLGPNLGGH